MFTVPGYVILWKKYNDGERLALAPAVSLIVYGIAAVFAHLAGLPVSFALIVLPLTLIVIIHRSVTAEISLNQAAVVLIALTMGFATQTLSAYPSSGDGIFQMLAAESFQTDHWMSINLGDNYFNGATLPDPIAYRPPLNSLGMALAFTIAGYSFETAKLYSAYFIAALAAITFLLAEKLFDRKTALYGTLIMVSLNPYMMSMGFDVLVYHVAAYLIFCFLYLWLRKTHWLTTAALAGALYLIHPMGIVFLLIFFAYEAYARRHTLIGYANLRTLGFIAVALLVASPWLVRNYDLFGSPLYSTGQYAMFYRDWEDHYRFTAPTMAGYLGFILNPKNLVLIKGGALLKTMIPPPYSFAYSRWQPQTLIDPVAMQYSIAGILSYPLFLAALYFAIKNWGRLVPFLFWMSLLASMVLFGMRHDYEHSLMFAEVLLLGIYGVSKVKEDKRVLALIALFLVFESAIFYPNKAAMQPDQEALDWITAYVPENATIMSRQADLICYMTGRAAYVTPNEPQDTIVRFARENGIGYFAVSKDDLRLRSMDLATLNETFNYKKQAGDYVIYQVT